MALVLAIVSALCCIPMAFAVAEPSPHAVPAAPGMLAIANSPAAAAPYGTPLVAGCAWATWVSQCQNLTVYSNGGSFTNQGCGAPNGCTFGPEFQCTELAQRYAYYAWGEPPTWDGYDDGAAADMWNAGPKLPVPLEQFPNGQGVPPARGDLMIFGPGWIGSYWDGDGHVAVVTDVTATTVQIAQENGTPSGLDTFSLSGPTVVQPQGYTPLIGWLHNGNAGRAPAAVALADGTQMVMWEGLGGHLWAATQTGAWSTPFDVTASWKGAGLSASSPALAATGNASLVAYWAGVDHHLWRASWSDTGWTAPADVSGTWTGGGADLVSAPSLAITPDGQQLVFWQDSGGHLWEAWSRQGSWYGPVDWTSAWGGAATLTSGPTVGVTPGGDQQLVFWQGPGGRVYEAWYAVGAWHGPADWTGALGLPGVATAPSLAVGSDGAQLLFFQAAGGDLNEVWYAAGGWHGPVDWSSRWSAGPIGSAPDVALTPDGSQELVFWNGADGSIWEAWWGAAQWNGPVDWGNLRQPLSTPAVAIDGAGEQDVFWSGPASHLMEASVTGSGWSSVTDVSAGLTGVPLLASSPGSVTDPTTGVRHVAWQGPGGHLWTVSRAGTEWSAPRDLSPAWPAPALLASAPSLALDGDQLLAFWRSGSGHIWESWLSGTTWNGPVDWTATLGLPAAASTPSAAVTPDLSTQLVFYEDLSGHLQEIWNAAGAWHGAVDWTSTFAWPALSSAPSVAVTPDGSQELVYWQSAGELWEAWWSNGWYGPVDWTARWTNGSLLISAPAVAAAPGGGMQVVFWQGVDGDLWEAWWTNQWNGPTDWRQLGPLN